MLVNVLALGLGFCGALAGILLFVHSLEVVDKQNQLIEVLERRVRRLERSHGA